MATLIKVVFIQPPPLFLLLHFSCLHFYVQHLGALESIRCFAKVSYCLECICIWFISVSAVFALVKSHSAKTGPVLMRE